MNLAYIWRHYPRLMQSIEEAHAQSAPNLRGSRQSAVQSLCAICGTAVTPPIPDGGAGIPAGQASQAGKPAPPLGLCDACANKHGFAFVRGLEVGTALLVKEADEVSQKYVAVARAAESRARAAIARIGAAEESLKDARRNEQLAKATAFCVGVAAIAWTALVWLMGR